MDKEVCNTLLTLGLLIEMGDNSQKGDQDNGQICACPPKTAKTNGHCGVKVTISKKKGWCGPGQYYMKWGGFELCLKEQNCNSRIWWFNSSKITNQGARLINVASGKGREQDPGPRAAAQRSGIGVGDSQMRVPCVSTQLISNGCWDPVPVLSKHQHDHLAMLAVDVGKGASFTVI